VHPFDDLSAYLDGALSPEGRASVQAHLDTCALCRTRLAELRGTARLIAALPMPVPSRSLIPRVSVPVWLAPLRTFSTFASGAAIFLFLASAVIASFPRAQSAATAGAPAPAPAASQGARSGAADASAAPGAQFQVSSPSLAPVVVTGDRTAAGPSTSPYDTAKEVGVRQDSPGSSSNTAVGNQTTRVLLPPEPAPLAILLSPWLWLVLAIAFATLSFIVGRRLRSA
jgi:anti-sigma factor RsiW